MGKTADRPLVDSDLKQASVSPTRLLKLEPDSTLQFTSRQNKSGSFTTLKLTNVSSDNVAFKVKTTKPKLYRVRPASGLLLLGESQDVQFIQQQQGADDSAVSRHRFLVQAVQTSSAEALTQEQWTELPKDNIENARLNAEVSAPVMDESAKDIQASPEMVFLPGQLVHVAGYGEATVIGNGVGSYQTRVKVQYPDGSTYHCKPDQLTKASPEMVFHPGQVVHVTGYGEATVIGKGVSSYHGRVKVQYSDDSTYHCTPDQLTKAEVNPDILPNDTVQWMWGDANLVGHAIAQMNPLRWSLEKTPSKTMADLAQHVKQYADRPVDMIIKTARGVPKRVHFSCVKEAMASLSLQAHEGGEVDCMESPAAAKAGPAQLVIEKLKASLLEAVAVKTEAEMRISLQPEDSLQWMWGDVNIIGRHMNPLRWSSEKSPSKTREDLAQYLERDAGRPVDMVMIRAEGVRKRMSFNSVTEAMAALPPEAQAQTLAAESGVRACRHISAQGASVPAGTLGTIYSPGHIKWNNGYENDVEKLAFGDFETSEVSTLTRQSQSTENQEKLAQVSREVGSIGADQIDSVQSDSYRTLDEEIQDALYCCDLPRLQKAGRQARDFGFEPLLDNATQKIAQLGSSRAVAVEAMHAAASSNDAKQLSEAIIEARRINASFIEIENAQSQLDQLENLRKLVRDLKDAANSCDTITLRSAILRAEQLDLRTREVDCAKEKIQRIDDVTQRLQDAANTRDIKKLHEAIQNAHDMELRSSAVNEAEEKLHCLQWEALDAALKRKNVAEARATIEMLKQAGVHESRIVTRQRELDKIASIQEQAERKLVQSLSNKDCNQIRAAMKHAQDAGVEAKKVSRASSILDRLIREASQNLSAALQSQSAKDMRASIQAAISAGVDARDIQNAQDQLRKLEAVLAVKAMKAAWNDMDALSSALESAKQTNVSIDEIACAERRLLQMQSEALQALMAAGNFQKPASASQHIWKTAVRSYVQDAADSSDVPTLCHAVNLSGQNGIDGLPAKKKLLRVVQDLVDHTHVRRWTHDRPKRCIQRPQEMPQKYIVKEVDPSYAERTFLNYSRARRSLGIVGKQYSVRTTDWAGSLDESKNEWMLFHGTSMDAAYNILQNGFHLHNADNKAACGPAVYFTENSTKADEYATGLHDLKMTCTFLICLVLGGRTHYTASKNPKQDGSIDLVTSKEYNSVLNDREKCSKTYREFVVMECPQVFPMCVVKYKRQF